MDVARCFILMMVSVLPAVSFASEIVQCPAAIEVQQQARAVPAGWLAYEPDSKHPLMSVEFSEGEPSKKVTVLPTGEKGAVSVWDFTPSAEGYWVSCSYNNTSVVVSRKLRSGTTSCRVVYDRGFATPLPRRISCTTESGEGAGEHDRSQAY
ncbi:STY0301 family protein [Geomonas anaerohicana]|uniref:STY0301 family protein n=1 Tax=Geomonas anaerohicana TaxID=2798583 RepID=UPI0038B2331E